VPHASSEQTSTSMGSTKAVSGQWDVAPRSKDLLKDGLKDGFKDVQAVSLHKGGNSDSRCSAVASAVRPIT
jgi:hypothetical protein